MASIGRDIMKTKCAMNIKSLRTAALLASFCGVLSGCSDMKIDEVSNPTPAFDFTEFFSGHTRASGWFSDRFGKPRRHFCGDFMGTQDGSVFVLDEKLYYTDGVYEERVWRVEISDSGVFRAESDSLVGAATGQLTGNMLAMEYAMNVKIEEDREWELDMKDFMILQPDGSLHNITHVHKWGIRIGTVSTQYQHHDGDSLCTTLSGQAAE